MSEPKHVESRTASGAWRTHYEVSGPPHGVASKNGFGPPPEVLSKGEDTLTTRMVEIIAACKKDGMLVALSQKSLGWAAGDFQD
ncbi:hypothetical protein [Rhodoferax sp.]|uniref:hypothetical protein n=1 Tax=Rhodoferax sp. TaxID=50421 RepID=UPI00374DBEB7